MKLFRRILAILLSAVMVLSCADLSALADTVLTLPQSLTVIEEEAFYGSQSIRKVVLPEGIREIRSLAFANSTLEEINLPDSLTYIAKNAFDGPEKVTVTFTPGTYAYDWAVENLYTEPVLHIASIAQDRDSAAVGETITWTSTAADGTAPYRYQFELYKDSTRVKQSSYSTNNTFSYTFTEAGTYSLKGRARDAEYNIAEKTLAAFTVTEQESQMTLTLTPDRETAYLHDAVTWTAQAQGGTEPYRYAFTLFIDGRQAERQTYSTNNTFTVTAETAGDYTVKADVLDADNNGCTITADPLSVILAELQVEELSGQEEAQTEDEVTWYTQATGGQEPYTYAYTLKKGDTVIESSAAGDENTYSAVLLETGTYTLTVTVTDVLGHTASGTAQCTVTLRPVAVRSITTESESWMTGDPLVWTVEAEGGDRNYVYAFTVYQGEDEVDFRGFSAEQSYSYTPETAGTYHVEVTVRDGARRTATETGGDANISVHPLEILSIAAEADMVRVGNTATVTTEAVGGAAPLRYSYEVYRNDELMAASAYSLSQSYSYRATVSGEYTFKVKTRDSEGTVIEATCDPVTFYDALSVSGVTADRESVLSGEPVTWTVTKTGGKGTISCEWFIYQGSKLEYTERNTKGSVVWTPLMSGNYHARVTVSDEEGSEEEAEGGTVISQAHAATPQEDFKFAILNGTYCSVNSYTGSDPAIVIPGEWTDENNITRTVQRIETNAFYQQRTIASVVIPDTVETMGENAFRGCESLVSVTGGSKLTNIGSYAFYDCESLRRYDFKQATATIGSYAFVGTTMSRFDGWDGLKTIGDYAFYGCTGLTEVNLPDGLEQISSWAFSGCTGLTGIEVPDSVMTIYSYAFKDCTNLASFRYPRNWTTAGSYIFDNCPKLHSITVPSGVTAIPASAFYGASSITAYSLPSSLRSIGDHAFYWNTGITGITLPAGLQTIGRYAFHDCTALETIQLPDSVTSIGSYAYCGCTKLASASLSAGMKSIPDYAFYDCTALTYVALPVNLELIGSWAFSECTALESIHLPDSVQTIYSYAFRSCSKLADINYPRSWATAGNGIFENCLKLISITIPDGVTAIPDFAFYGARGFAWIHLPETLETIGQYAFYDCTGLTAIQLPDSVTEMGNYAYYGCTGLTGVSLSESMTKIPSYAFSGCTGLTSVHIPDGMEMIGSWAFYGCTALEGIHLPDSIHTIYSYAFRNCSKLARINYPRSWVTANSNIFENCPRLLSITVPEGVTSIPDFAFYGGSCFAAIYLPDTLETIGQYAFYDCSGLTAVDLPDSVTSVGPYAYDGCTGLTGVSLSANIKTIMANTFNGCTSLTSVSLPAGLELIGTWAFNGCTMLESIHLPDSVTKIESYAFRDCSRLAGINYPMGWTSAGNSIFENCVKLVSITVPEGVTTIPDYAFSGANKLLKAYLPGSVESIGENAFYDHHEDLVVYSSSAYVAQWCEQHNIQCNLPDVQASVAFAQPQWNMSTTDALLHEVQVNADGKWSITSYPEWLALSERTGDGNSVLTLYAQANETEADRTGVITVSAAGALASFTVVQAGTATQPDQVTFEMSDTAVKTGENVRFTVQAQNADTVQLFVDGTGYDTAPVWNNTATIDRAFSQGGTRQIQIQASRDGTAGQMSAAQTLQVSSYGDLETTTVSSEGPHYIGMPVTVTWGKVNFAKNYFIYLSDGGNYYYLGKKDENDERTCTIDGMYFKDAGDYSVDIIATSPGYSQTTSSLDLAVAARTADFALITPGNGGAYETHDQVVYTIQNPSGYPVRVRIARMENNQEKQVYYLPEEGALTGETPEAYFYPDIAGTYRAEAVAYASELVIDPEDYWGTSSGKITVQVNAGSIDKGSLSVGPGGTSQDRTEIRSIGARTTLSVNTVDVYDNDQLVISMDAENYSVVDEAHYRRTFRYSGLNGVTEGFHDFKFVSTDHDGVQMERHYRFYAYTPDHLGLLRYPSNGSVYLREEPGHSSTSGTKLKLSDRIEILGSYQNLYYAALGSVKGYVEKALVQEREVIDWTGAALKWKEWPKGLDHSDYAWTIWLVPTNYNISVSWELNRALPEGYGYNVYAYIDHGMIHDYGMSTNEWKMNTTPVTESKLSINTSRIKSIWAAVQQSGWEPDTISLRFRVALVDKETNREIISCATENPDNLDEQNFVFIRSDWSKLKEQQEMWDRIMVWFHDALYRGEYKDTEGKTQPGYSYEWAINLSKVYSFCVGDAKDLKELPCTRGALIAETVMKKASEGKAVRRIDLSEIEKVLSFMGLPVDFIQSVSHVYSAQCTSNWLSGTGDANKNFAIFRDACDKQGEIDDLSDKFTVIKDGVTAGVMIMNAVYDYIDFSNVKRSEIQSYIDSFRSTGDSALGCAASFLEIMTGGTEKLGLYLGLAYGGTFAKGKLADLGYTFVDSFIPGYKAMAATVKFIGDSGFNAASVFSAGFDLQVLGAAADELRDKFINFLPTFYKDPVKNYKEYEKRRDAFLAAFRLEVDKLNKLIEEMDKGIMTSMAKAKLAFWGVKFETEADREEAYDSCTKYYNLCYPAYFSAFIQPFIH